MSKISKTKPKAETQPGTPSWRRSPDLRALLKMQREMAGLTREELAERAGVTAKTIEQAETDPHGTASWKDLYAIGVAVGASMAVRQQNPKPPVEMEAILREFDRLLESKRGKVFLQDQPDKEHASICWDIVGDPDRNWLYVVASNRRKNVRFAAVTDDAGGWSIAGQLFGMDVETGAIAEDLSNKLFQKHKVELLG